MKKIFMISFCLLIFFMIPILSQDIFKASESGDLEKIKELLEKDPKLLNTADSQGKVPLHLAANFGQKESVKYLIKKGAEIDAVNTYGYTPLHFSIRNRHLEVAKILLQSGASADIPNVWGSTPLFTCAGRNYIDGASLLIKNKADVNKQSETGKTPLHAAVSAGHAEMIALLLKNQADVNAADKIGHTPVFAAATNNHTEILEFLINQGAATDIKDKIGKTPLHRAVIAGYLSAVQVLAKAGVDINSKDDQNRPPVFYAVRYGHNILAEWLKSKGAQADVMIENRGYFNFSAAELKKKQAVIWYLGHSGWAIKTQEHFLIFDYFEDTERPDEPKLANGRIHTPEIFDQKVYVFASHEHADHFDKSILEWEKSIRNIKYIFGWKAMEKKDYYYMGPKMKLKVDDIEIECFHSPEAGPLEGNFLVQVDGLVIYHSGDYSRGHDFFKQDMRALKDADVKIDLFFMLAGNQMDNEEALFALKTVFPKYMFPMHGGGSEHTYKEFAAFVSKEKIKTSIICAENRGDRFFYSGNKIRVHQ